MLQPAMRVPGTRWLGLVVSHGSGRRRGVISRDRIAIAAACVALPLVAAAHPAVGIVVDRTGTVFYSDTVHVWTIRPDGTKAIVVRGVHTHELWLDADGLLYGEHLWYEGDATGRWGHRVWKRARDGVVSDVIPARPGFLSDYRDFSFARDAAGAMFWMEGSKPAHLRMKQQGREALTLASFGFTNQSWLSVMPDGTAYVSEGGVLWHVRAGASPKRLPDAVSRSRSRLAVMGVAGAADGSIYVAAYEDRAVRRVSAVGEVTTVTSTPPGWGPTGIAVAADGTVWVLEASVTNAQRVRRIGRDGTVRVF